ncbi:MAG: hypothetical protein M3Z21_05955 [Pseudomonadota bacterium]|nr:hypothetical protein [Pseudomonadota bacterium]
MLAWCEAWRELAATPDWPPAATGGSAARPAGVEVVQVLAAMVLALTGEVEHDH